MLELPAPTRPTPAPAGVFDLSTLTADQRLELTGLIDELERRRKTRLIESMFPDTGPLRRELYPRHLEFFLSGAINDERIFMAGNRVGKTVAAGTELAYHLTGRYPHWWRGRRFTRAIRALASGDTHDTTRDIIQDKMLGGTTDETLYGTGLIPGDCIVGWTKRMGVPGAVEKITVKHLSGENSELWLRSYVQGRKIFQGFELDVFWPDEECPEDVYEEGQVRLLTTGGISMLTFTPLNGLTTLVQALTSNDPDKPAISRDVIRCGWDDVPHLSEAAKAKLLSKLMPHQRDARTKGIPALGSGAIYPVPETDIVIPDMALPEYWPRAYGFDVGWNRTAAIWGALNRESDVLYLYSEHYRAHAEPSVHVAGIKARGEWIHGAIDPASRGRQQKDGEQLFQSYTDLGLNIAMADNGVESGLYDVWERMSTGRLKVFQSCRNWIDEYRIYRRDDKGRIVKERDHLMDATRYLVKTGVQLARVKPKTREGVRQGSWRTA
ncbi:Bacteriophage terminase large (ATPase) subunit [Variovorax sp. PBS-H4]|uniref:terminase large subunit domain-containing protein n=1 Tax=Variovorax sp. PBS-H4 TaxID=434008 RepID=UPI0013187A5E|nr:terminase family protein [Variovorax sp. PBS-H4]VTU38333.1 Bacteriophage terminase large (ATPase) subunit [Variovorax sp. PBS-H4]